ncbi:NADPH:quinone reductase-like Zn-dependent oxidoreductase [Archangium gephyra]|uniref:NADPH:quinone reductase-like Zn-dependent oxidoreductase n=1 Tax=Archangium gephyra TaxID=48 RepID=A0ABX9K427_9BACT|nr:NADPH:quinone oxidoreductase family protein [Archangium gephyra]REG32903.1 NADPH:quinone reductase-like Zn-dependent oxidoreductase [Archangium gephyra]
MKAWRAETFGKPSDVLRLVDVDVPVPGPGEALLRVLAANIGLPDRMMLEGRYFLVPTPPVTPGQEVVGIVEAAGRGYPFPIGTRVIGGTNFTSGSGGLAEYCLSPGRGAVPASDDMPDEHAAAFLGTFHVAYVGLVNRARARPGESLLVLGGSGGTGSTAIQLAKALGLTVIATVRDGKKAAYCRQQGADHVIDLGTGSLDAQVRALTGGKGADIVYDTVGSTLADQALDAIAIGGRYILIGFAGGSAFPTVEPFKILTHGISVTGALHSVRTAEERDDAITTLGRLFSEGKISMPIDKIIPFAEVPEALDRLGGAVNGKLIARIGDQRS